MARWFRARRLLSPSEKRVLDLGCAFGFLTERLGRPEAAGMEYDLGFLQRAARGKLKRYVRGAGEAVPFADGAFDAVTFLDVIEHVRDDHQVVREIYRVLRPGGTLILSAPGDGILAWADSQNVFWQLQRAWANVRGQRIPAYDWHRHYSLTDLERLLGSGFRIDTVQRTGLGLAEFVNLLLLILCRGLLRSERLYGVLQYLYFSAYMIEDELPFGRYAYHLLVRATKIAEPGGAPDLQ